MLWPTTIFGPNNEEISYGPMEACHNSTLYNVKNLAIVHACKTPCFESRGINPALPIKDRLWVETDRELYLNLIDPVKPLFYVQSFYKYFDFVARHWGKNPILVHCNEGRSRSPTLCWLWFANQGFIHNNDPDRSINEMRNLKVNLWPGLGLRTFVYRNWVDLMNYRPNTGEPNATTSPT